jgi:hypothetical protein
MIHKLLIRTGSRGCPMLAAVPTDESRILELFNLALKIRLEQRELSPDLKDYFNSILRQAKELANNPRSISGNISPEAIQLARQLQETNALRDAVLNVSDIGGVSPAVADRILANLSTRVAP